MHGFDNNTAVLRRWAAQAPELPLPSDWETFARQMVAQATKIEEADPVLVQLLSGKASAGLKADVLQGKFPERAPDQASIKRAEKQQQIESLVASKPWANGRVQNLTAALMLEDLAPDVAARERRKANFQNHDERDAAQKREIQEQNRRMKEIEISGLQARLNALTRNY